MQHPKIPLKYNPLPPPGQLSDWFRGASVVQYPTTPVAIERFHVPASASAFRPSVRGEGLTEKPPGATPSRFRVRYIITSPTPPGVRLPFTPEP
jgi:hypothetical protein